MTIFFYYVEPSLPRSGLLFVAAATTTLICSSATRIAKASLKRIWG